MPKPHGMDVSGKVFAKGKKPGLPKHVRKTAKHMAKRGMISEKRMAKMMGSEETGEA